MPQTSQCHNTSRSARTVRHRPTARRRPLLQGQMVVHHQPARVHDEQRVRHVPVPRHPAVTWSVYQDVRRPPGYHQQFVWQVFHRVLLHRPCPRLVEDSLQSGLQLHWDCGDHDSGQRLARDNAQRLGARRTTAGCRPFASASTATSVIDLVEPALSSGDAASPVTLRPRDAVRVRAGHADTSCARACARQPAELTHAAPLSPSTAERELRRALRCCHTPGGAASLRPAYLSVRGGMPVRTSCD